MGKSKVFSNLKVSVVMPAYQCEAYIEDSIRSVIGQTYKNIELIVVIDGGSDSTYNIVSSLCKMDSRVVKISHKTNLGIAEARNTGITAATGEFIAFCDSDDIWLPIKLETQIGLMNRDDVCISHSSAEIIDAFGQVTGIRYSPIKIDNKMMRERNYIINSSALILRAKAPPIYQSQIKHEDYDMWLRLFRYGAVSVGSSEPLIQYRIHSDNITKNKFKSFWWMVTVQRENGFTWVEVITSLLKNIRSRYLDLIRQGRR